MKSEIKQKKAWNNKLVQVATKGRRTERPLLQLPIAPIFHNKNCIKIDKTTKRRNYYENKQLYCICTPILHDICMNERLHNKNIFELRVVRNDIIMRINPVEIAAKIFYSISDRKGSEDDLYFVICYLQNMLLNS